MISMLTVLYTGLLVLASPVDQDSEAEIRHEIEALVSEAERLEILHHPLQFYGTFPPPGAINGASFMYRMEVRCESSCGYLIYSGAFDLNIISSLHYFECDTPQNTIIRFFSEGHQLGEVGFTYGGQCMVFNGEEYGRVPGFRSFFRETLPALSAINKVEDYIDADSGVSPH